MKKFLIGLLLCGVITSLLPTFAYVKRKQYIYQPVVTTYFCKIDRQKCKVTEHTYIENGVSYYKAVCSGDNMNARRLENIAKSDVSNKRRRYCEVNF